MGNPVPVAPAVIEVLARRYCADRQSFSQLAREFGLTEWTVAKTLRRAGVDIRPTGGSTTASEEFVLWVTRNGASALEELFRQQDRKVIRLARIFGVTPNRIVATFEAFGVAMHPRPTADELERLIHVDHRRLADIGALYDVCASTVAVWVTEYGLKRPNGWFTRVGHEPRLPMRDDIASRYEAGMPLAQIGREFDLSEPTIRKLCGQYGIAVRSGGWSGAYRLAGNDGHKVRSSYEKRVDDWLAARCVPHTYEPRLTGRYRADFFANGWYVEIWGVTRGGRASSTYRDRRAKKAELYKINNLPLIEIEAWWFQRRLRGLWERRLERCLEAPTNTREICEAGAADEAAA